MIDSRKDLIVLCGKIVVAFIFSLISLSLVYITRAFVSFDSFLCFSFAISLLDLIIVIDEIYYNNATKDVIISRSSMLVFIFLFNLFVSFSNELMIRLFFLDLFLTIASYVELITILSVVKLVMRFR